MREKKDVGIRCQAVAYEVGNTASGNHKMLHSSNEKHPVKYFSQVFGRRSPILHGMLRPAYKPEAEMICATNYLVSSRKVSLQMNCRNLLSSSS